MNNTKKNYLKFTLNENLRKFIKVSNISASDDKDKLIKYLENCVWNVGATDGGFNMSCCRVTFKCPPDNEIKQWYVTKNDRDGKEILSFPIDNDRLLSGYYTFRNCHFTHDNETDSFIATINDSTDFPSYYFDIESFENLPKIGYSKYVLIGLGGCRKVWKINYIERDSITLENNNTGSYYTYSPIDFLTGLDSYGINKIASGHIKRNKDGLLIPGIEYVYPLTVPEEYLLDKRDIKNTKTNQHNITLEKSRQMDLIVKGE